LARGAWHRTVEATAQAQPPGPSLCTSGQLREFRAPYGDLTTPHALDLLDWTDDRLDTALANAKAHLEPTGLQLAIADDHLTPAAATRRAARPDPRPPRPWPASPPPVAPARGPPTCSSSSATASSSRSPGADYEDDLDSFAAHTLIESNLAVATADPHQGGPPSVQIHPDVCSPSGSPARLTCRRSTSLEPERSPDSPREARIV